MRKIKVMIVDDSVVIRKIVTDTLSQDSEIEVVGVAANGKIALQKISGLEPDILTLDIEMPEMNGLETLDHLRVNYPNLPVIMFSSLTQRSAAATLDALTRGASDYVTKPANMGNMLGALEHIRKELIPRIKHLCARGLAASAPASEIPVAAKIQPQARPNSAVNLKLSTSRIDCVAIGVSTGGPNALSELLPVFTDDFPVPILIVQHMPPQFTKLLADRLSNKSHLEVVENQPGLNLEPGRAILAAGDYHMTIHRNNTQVITGANQDPPENSCRPAVDVTFRSVAELYGPHVLAVVLTGMGQDGLKGCQLIRQAGGRVIAQDEATSVVWGMPGFVTKEGLAEKVLPLEEIAMEIVNMCRFGRTAAPSR